MNGNKQAEMRIRVTAKQKERIRQKAARAEISMSALLIRASLYNLPPISQEEIDRLLYKLDRYGRELNDMVRWYHTYKFIMGGEENDVCAVWADVRRCLNETLAWIEEPVTLPVDPVLKSRRGEKTENVHLRITADQKIRIRARAKRMGMSVSRYVLRATLKKAPTLRRMSIERTYIALQRIGNNLTQAKQYLDSAYGTTGTEFQYLKDEFLWEADRFRRAFGWDVKIRMEDERDGLCQGGAGGDQAASIQSAELLT